MNRWLPLVPSMGIACDRVAWAYRPEILEGGEDDNCSIASCASPSTTAWLISTVIAPFAMAAHHRVERVRHEIKKRAALPAVAGGGSVGRAHLPPASFTEVWQRLSAGCG